MTSTLVDSNVLLDFIEDDPDWRGWSTGWMERALGEGDLVINAIVLSEVAGTFATAEQLNATLPRTYFRREDLPFEAAFVAGKAHFEYRRRGGARQRTLPDFLIGAHASVKGYRLLTRDARRYRAYFPDLDILDPETHP